MRRFDLKTGTGIDFAHFGLESGMVFEGTTGVSQGLNVFQMNKKQRIICGQDLENRAAQPHQEFL